jgi:hypothetical protein
VKGPKELRLDRGSHPAPFDAEGNPTLCAMEFAAYLAGGEHSDSPACVSPVLLRFLVRWNDDLDDGTRQRLRPYIARTIGTAGDGQDEARSYMALDWLIRVHTPAFLAAAGLTDEADKLRGLAEIEGIEAAKAAGPKVRAAGDAARAAAGDAARDAAWAAAWAAVGDAAWAAAGDAAGAAARAAAWDAAGAAAWGAAGAAAWGAAGAAAGAALHPTIEGLQESAFELLDKMCDPGGVHDVPTEAHFFERTGRRALV